MKKIGTIIFGLLMITAGAVHFALPATYEPFLSPILPESVVTAIIYASGLVEILIGTAMFVPSLQGKASLAILFLMVAFLPLHIADVFRDNPAIGNHTAAYIRLPIQFVLVFLAYLLWKSHRKH